MKQIATIGTVKIWQDEDGGVKPALLFRSGATINADGALTAYAPKNSNLPALDYLENAGGPGNWWGIYAPPNGKGPPVTQTIFQQAPGYYISMTALVNPAAQDNDTNRYLDSERYPFAIVPGSFGNGWKLGDVGFCLNEKTQDNMYWATGDIGPKTKIGEVSILLGRCLGLNSDPKKGGIAAGIVYVVFPGSDPGYKPWPDKCQIAIDTFTGWGGPARLKTLIKEL